MSEFTRLAGIEPLYKYDLDPKIDKAKAREAAHVEMERLRKEKAHQSVLDDHTKVMSGLKKPDQAGILNVDDEPEPAQDENLDMGRQGDPEAEPFANLESVAPGDVWVQHFKTQKSIYFFPLRKGKNGNFQGLMYDPNFSRKAKVSSVPKINGPKSSRSLWKVETRVPMAAKEAFMDHPKYKQALEASEAVQFNEGASKRYEIVVKGKLHSTSPKPAMAIVIAKRQKGSVQVVDSKTGNILYDSEIRPSSRAPKARKARVSSMQQLRLNRRSTDAKLRLGKLD